MNRQLSAVLLLVAAAWAGDLLWSTASSAGLRDVLVERARQLLDQSPGGRPIPGRDGWLFERNELTTLTALTLHGDTRSMPLGIRPELADPIPAIVDFRDRLAAHGIGLVLVPVPNRAEVVPQALVESPAFGGLMTQGRLDGPSKRAIEELRETGVSVVDLVGKLSNLGNVAPFTRGDPHWSSALAALGAHEVVSLTASQVADVERIHTIASWDVQWYRSPLYTALAAPGVVVNVEVPMRRVWTPQGGLIDIRDPAAPVTVLGDSNVHWWRGKNASFVHQLAHEFGVSVEGVSTPGGGASGAREEFCRRTADVTYLESKRLVVWVFSVRALYDNQWKITRLGPQPNPTQLATLRANRQPSNARD